MREELERISKFNEIEMVECFLDGLKSQATGADFENQIYQAIRTKLIGNKSFEPLLPKWVITIRSTKEFWAFIKGRYGTYAERREFLNNEFNPLLNYLENKPISPLEERVDFDGEYIRDQWVKAFDRIQSEPDGAITMARTLIESTLKYILDEQAIQYNDGTELAELYKEVAKTLNLAPEQHQEQIFKQILGGASGIISGLGAMRNKLGDAHGKSKNSIKPLERHSELAVNLAGTMAIFLIKTYKETKVLE